MAYNLAIGILPALLAGMWIPLLARRREQSSPSERRLLILPDSSGTGDTRSSDDHILPGALSAGARRNTPGPGLRRTLSYLTVSTVSVYLSPAHGFNELQRGNGTNHDIHPLAPSDSHRCAERHREPRAP